MNSLQLRHIAATFVLALFACPIVLTSINRLPSSGACFASGKQEATTPNTVTENLLSGMRNALDQSNWNGLKSAVQNTLLNYKNLPPESKPNAAENLIAFVRILLKAGRTAEASALLNPIADSLSTMSANMNSAKLLLETADLLQSLDMSVDAQRMLTLAKTLSTNSNTWRSDKDSLSYECQCVEQMIESAKQIRSAGKIDLAKTSAPRTAGIYWFNYVALASRSGVFRGNTSTGLYKEGDLRRSVMPGQGSFVGSYGHFETRRGIEHQFENFNWAYNIPWNTIQHVSASEAVIYGSVPPRPLALPFPPAPTAPPGANDLKDQGIRGSNLAPGDYVVSRLWTRQLNIVPPGRVRIFIQGDKLSAGPCFWAEVNSSINARFGNRQERSELEIWYNGYGTIKLDHNCTMNGIIYAPNAYIELGPNNVDYTGAIVARTIFADGNVALKLDDALLHRR